MRALSGADELDLGYRATALPRAAFVTELLLRCVDSIDGCGVESDTIRALTCGDREALLLHVRAATWGPSLALVVVCEACGEPMDIDVDSAAIAHDPVVSSAAEHVLDGVVFRLPTGRDEEAVAALDVEEGAAELVRRCTSGADVDPDALAARVEELDPQARTELAVECPTCGVGGAAELDLGELLRADVVLGRRSEIEVHVHLLALHYHWAEVDVLALPTPRRRRYVELLADTLDASLV